jgi:hypothetical protein
MRKVPEIQVQDIDHSGIIAGIIYELGRVEQKVYTTLINPKFISGRLTSQIGTGLSYKFHYSYRATTRGLPYRFTDEVIP